MASRGYIPVTVDRRRMPKVDDETASKVRKLAKQRYEIEKELKSLGINPSTMHRIIKRKGAYE